MDSELARAYNNLGEPGEYKLFAQALELLKPHEEYFRGNHKYYFRLAYSYYYLDEDGLALHLLITIKFDFINPYYSTLFFKFLELSNDTLKVFFLNFSYFL